MDGTGRTSTLTTDACRPRNISRCRAAMATTPSAEGSDVVLCCMGDAFDVCPGSIPSKKSTISTNPPGERGESRTAVFLSSSRGWSPRLAPPPRPAPASGVVARGVLASSIVSTESSCVDES